MRKKIYDILFINDKFVRNRFRYKHFLKFHNDLYVEINSKVSDEYTFKEKVYICYHEISNPVCKMCGKKTTLVSFNMGFHEYCCVSCMVRDEDTKLKVRNTNIKKFGVDAPLKCQKMKDKARNVIIEKYGVDSIFKSNAVKEKIKETNLNKYGVDNPFKLKEFQDKANETKLKKYGVICTTGLDSVKEKYRKTSLLNYGVEHPNKCKLVRNKTNKTIKNNYIKKYSELFNINKSDIVTDCNCDVEIHGLCPHHESFTISKHNLYNRVKYGLENICTICNPINVNPAIRETEIYDYLKTFNILVQRKNRKILNGLEIDFYIPGCNLGIEFNGLYWHCDKFRDSEYHAMKTNICNSKSIELLHIFEDEWVFKKEIVKSIIKTKLGLINNIVDSNDCDVNVINYDQSNSFLIDNYIGDNRVGNVNLGLIYDSELLCMVCLDFIGDECNISLFLTKNNYLVIDGYKKIFKYILEKYNPKLVKSKSDRRYKNDEILMSLGFKYGSTTEPDFWYVDKFKTTRINKYDFDLNKVNMKYIFKIYDCGYDNYIYINN